MKFIASFILYLLCSVPILSANGIGMHYIENYENYPASDGQVWQIGVYDDGWTYFASKNGFLQFDGNRWSLIPTRNGLEARSVCASHRDEKIYVAGINEFGYLAPDDSGSLIYTCLSDSLGEEADVGNFWGLYRSNGHLYIQSDYHVLCYGGDRFSRIESDAKLNCSDMIDGVMYLGTSDGLKIVAGDRIFPAIGAESISGKRVRRVLPYDKRLLVVTDDAVYDYDGKTMHRIVTEADSRLAASDIYTAAIRDNTLALGTVLGGVFIVDLTNGSVEVYNHNSGLKNETVLSLAFDRSGNLWAGTDDGIERIMLTMPVTTLSSGQLPVGSGYAMANDGDTWYIGTNRGLFRLNSSPGSFGETEPFTYSLVGGLRGQVWGLTNIDGRVYCMHDNGLYAVDGNTISRISDFSGVWNFQTLPGYTDRAVAGTYTGIVYLQRNPDGTWQNVGYLDGYRGSAFVVVPEDERHIWVDNNSGGMRITVNKAKTAIESEKDYGQNKGLPSSKDISISRVGGKVYFATSDGAYYYDASRDSIVPDKWINGLIGKGVNLLRLTEKDDFIYAMTAGEILKIDVTKRGSDNRGAVRRLPIYPANARPMSKTTDILPTESGIVILPSKSGFSFYDFAGDSTQRVKSRESGRINYFAVTTPVDSILYESNFRRIKPHPRIPYESNCVRFDFHVPDVMTSAVVGYRYRLNNQTWSELTTVPFKEFTDLIEGSYVFHVQAMMSDGTVSEDAFEFTILPPWYRSGWAYVAYALIIIAVLAGIYLLERRRVRGKERSVAKAKDQEIALQQARFAEKEEEQETRIANLEQDKLKLELEHKTQEMANLLITLSSKHETLLSFKAELKKLYANFHGEAADRKQILALQTRINTALQAEDVMERIEKEFDLVHNNFIKQLRQTYPDLSRNELMMCMYIRMNLSNKEIAPLMNMSTRGVETLRYRMRRKMGLERENSLTDFLGSIT